MDLNKKILSAIEAACQDIFGSIPPSLTVQPTRPEFEGSHTLVCFPLSKPFGQKPDEIAHQIGAHLMQYSVLIADHNVVKGFLNLVLSDTVWLASFWSFASSKNFGLPHVEDKEMIIEISSPNTNKPLHLGHLRNNFLGASVSALYETLGYKMHKVQIINDRGIHICKSMLAWEKTGHGETPETSGLKGDKLIGKYYVTFNTLHKDEKAALMAKGMTPKQAEKEAPIMREAVAMLRYWEEKKTEVIALWKRMNEWVYAGFDVTYKRMGVRFDKLYFESETYLLGKKEVLRGLKQGIFFKKEDGSVWVDLTDKGMDQKVLLRSDGTSVYMTQDIGTAILRYRDFPNASAQIYTVGNEQEYHFKVLFLILAKLGYPWADACYHLSYGMVDLPSGKMKSREGMVVDADDLMEEMVVKAREETRELGKIDDLTSDERLHLFDIIGIGALKYYLLRVDPKKRIVFDPKESIQLQGYTGPFIQYTYARIRSLLRKAANLPVDEKKLKRTVTTLLPVEKELVQCIMAYPVRVLEAAREYTPSHIANYVYELSKTYNRLYQTLTILGEENTDMLQFRIFLSRKTADIIRHAMNILQIEVPEKM